MASLLLSSGRTILQHLCEVGSYEQQNACRQQLGETQGSLRFVKYELGRKGQAETETASQVDDIQVSDCITYLVIFTILYVFTAMCCVLSCAEVSCRNSSSAFVMWIKSGMQCTQLLSAFVPGHVSTTISKLENCLAW